MSPDSASLHPGYGKGCSLDEAKRNPGFLTEAPEKYAHLLCGLNITAALGRLDAGAIRLPRLFLPIAVKQRFAEEFPSGGVVGIERHGALEMCSCKRRIVVKVGIAQTETK